MGLSTMILLSVSAAATGGSLVASSKQQAAENRRIELETATAELEAADRAVENTRSFRQAISSQLALSGLRGAPGSSTSHQVSSLSYANYLKDQNAIMRQMNLLPTQKTLAKTESSFNRLNRDLSLLGNLGLSAAEATNLSGQKKPNAKSVGGMAANVAGTTGRGSISG